ncbi:MAG: di-trans,poly-cis-decaprenylcistransferase, partial [Xanthomonadales bacterium]|nr:di-trans,poly-cis-decaprenylcistransferase [Xanthomonadales bacterium]
RKRPRTMGHQAGLKALRAAVEHCARAGVKVLTVFAFSSENWNRPQKEVSRLMDLFMRALDKEVQGLHENNVSVRFIGDRQAFQPELQDSMARAEQLTGDNTGLVFNVAANYGGRWDIVQAARTLAVSVRNGELAAENIDEQALSGAISTAACGDPDLFIRTGGEMRISNFLLWQCAYTEFYFTPVLWPDFDGSELDAAFDAYRRRERRFGRTGQQVRGTRHA